MSGYEDEDRHYCGSDGSEAGAHDDTFLERSDRESREEGSHGSQHLSMSRRHNSEDEDFAPSR